MGGSASLPLGNEISFGEQTNASARSSVVIPRPSTSSVIRAKVATAAESDLVHRALEFMREETQKSAVADEVNSLVEARKLIAQYRKLSHELLDLIADSGDSPTPSAPHSSGSSGSGSNEIPKTSTQSFFEHRAASDADPLAERRRSSMIKRGAFSPQMGPSLQTQITNSNEVTADEDGNVIKVNGYKLGAVIGTGSFGVVVRARHETGMLCAIKIIDRKRLKRAQFGPRTSNASTTDLKREIAIQKRLRHPNILPLIEVIDDPSHPKTYMVTSFVDGGALMPDHSKASPLPECRARRLMAQLVSAMDYLHKHNIIHKDIKPSNLLVDKTDRLLLSDFGAAQAFRDDEDPMINRTDGTMAFLAPEMCSGEAFNGKLADIWAVGATLFMMIFGSPPFVADTAQTLIDLIQEGNVNYPPRPGSAGVTSKENDHDVVGLLKSILEKDVSKRASFAQISAHPWSTDYGRAEFLLPEVMGPIEVSEKEIATAISAYKVNSVRTLGSVLIAKQNILQYRSPTSPGAPQHQGDDNSL